MTVVIFWLLLACSGKPKIQMTESFLAVSGWLLEAQDQNDRGQFLAASGLLW